MIILESTCHVLSYHIIIIIISNELDGGIVTLLLQDHLTMSVSRNSA